MPKKGSVIGAEGRRVFTTDPILNLWICVYMLAVEDSKITDIPFTADPLTKRMIADAPAWLHSDTGKAVYNFIMEGLTNG
jgi:hypothetical protein